MKKTTRSVGELRSAYDFYSLKGVVRGKYAARLQPKNNLIHLEPDVAKVFVDEESVNHTLRSLIRLAKAETIHTH
ncbi:MAG: hypothetical protein IPN90_08215 [Elusimicrobia bacterium]|nr:hypothetical protein [Elusimicrobiota bacterium]